MNAVSEVMWITSFFSSCSFVYCSFSNFLSSKRARHFIPVLEARRERRSPERALQSNDYLLASNPLTSLAELAALAQSQLPGVRSRVAANPNCPLTILVRLAQDANPEVRVGLAYNPRVPSILLEWLVENDCVDLRLVLAGNGYVPRPLLQKLSQDNNPYVAKCAKQTLMRLPAVTISSERHTLW